MSRLDEIKKRDAELVDYANLVPDRRYLLSMVDALQAELAESQRAVRNLTEEVALWKENHKFASKLADDLTQDGIKERAELAAAKAAISRAYQELGVKEVDPDDCREAVLLILSEALATKNQQIDDDDPATACPDCGLHRCTCHARWLADTKRGIRAGSVTDPVWWDCICGASNSLDTCGHCHRSRLD